MQLADGSRDAIPRRQVLSNLESAWATLQVGVSESRSGGGGGGSNGREAADAGDDEAAVVNVTTAAAVSRRGGTGRCWH